MEEHIAATIEVCAQLADSEANYWLTKVMSTRRNEPSVANHMAAARVITARNIAAAIRKLNHPQEIPSEQT